MADMRPPGSCDYILFSHMQCCITCIMYILSSFVTDIVS